VRKQQNKAASEETTKRVLLVPRWLLSAQTGYRRTRRLFG
jgi:hypothetical protein